MSNTTRKHCSSCQAGSSGGSFAIQEDLGGPPVPRTSGSVRSEPDSDSKTPRAGVHVKHPPETTRSQPTPPSIDGPAPPRRLPASKTLPDSMVDPFTDETHSDSAFQGANRSGGQRVRGQTIQYQRTATPGSRQPVQTIGRPVQEPTYRQRFDPQASNNATSADYWAGTDKESDLKASRVTPVSDQPPTLLEIHKRAYNLRLADEDPIAQPAVAGESETQPTESSGPARLPSGNHLMEPLAAPVSPAMRLKASPASSLPTMRAPIDNPLR